MTLKQFDPKVHSRSVVDAPDAKERWEPTNPFVLQIAALSSAITPWGKDIRKRDAELRELWIEEPWLASTVYSVTVRNASFKWEIRGRDPSKKPPKSTIEAVTKMLQASDRGRGWESLILKTCQDMLTTDNGAFWELIRATKSPSSPVVNIAQLDSARCTRTGDPRYPVIYADRFGREKVLRWWEVQTIEELPSPVENMFNAQVCAVSRALLSAEYLRDVQVFKHEKVAGGTPQSIDFIGGVTEHMIQSNLELAEEGRLNRGLYRYFGPIIVAGINPEVSLSHEHIDLAALPDSFDEDITIKWYIAQLAAAFGVDYQELAPLMTGNLGSSQQSEILHLKTRGKGPALFMTLLENVLNNNGILPRNVKFEFKEQDLRSEREKAEAMFTRSKGRSMMLKSGEIDAQAARELAVLAGDLPEHMVSQIEERQEAEEQEAPEIDNMQAEQVMQGAESHGMTESLPVKISQEDLDWIYLMMNTHETLLQDKVGALD